MARARVAKKKGSTDLRPQELRTPGARGSALCLVGQPRGASSAIRRSLTCHHPHAIASPSPHRLGRRPAQRRSDDGVVRFDCCRRERGAQLARHEQGGPPHALPTTTWSSCLTPTTTFIKFPFFSPSVSTHFSPLRIFRDPSSFRRPQNFAKCQAKRNEMSPNISFRFVSF